MTRIEVGWAKFPSGAAQAFQVGLGKVVKPENKGDFTLLDEDANAYSVACFLDQSELSLYGKYKPPRIDHRGKLRLDDPAFGVFIDDHGQVKTFTLFIEDIKLSVCRATEVRTEANREGCHQTVSLTWSRTWPPMGGVGRIICEVFE